MARRLKWLLVLALTTMVALGILCGSASADGSCGENVTWSFSTSGELSISGTGAMTDYSPDSAQWKNINTSNVKTIVIHEGVTHIGAYAFPNFDNLTSVTIADSVISIGTGAFYGCVNMKTVSFPGVRTIGVSAFGFCSSLKAITIPSSVTTIGAGAFYNCGMLNSVTYNGSRTEWEKITIGANNAPLMGDSVTFLMTDGGTCGTDVRWSLSNDGELVISGTGPMSNYTANNPAPWQSSAESIVSISFEDGVTNVGNRAFYNCSALTEVSFGNTVSNIGNEAFYNCKSLSAPDFPSSLKAIGSRAFEYCNGLAGTIVIPEGVTSIYGGAFANCSNLEGVSLPSTLTEFCLSAFNNCSSMASITLPAEAENLNYIQPDPYPIGLAIYAYRDSTAAYTMGRLGLGFKVPESNYSLQYVFDPFNDAYPTGTLISGVDKNAENFTFPEDVTGIGETAFQGCTELGAIRIPQDIASIGDYAFDGCTKLTDVLILGDSTLIAENAFGDVNGVTLYGHANSSAQTFATARGIPFVEILGTHALTETPVVDATCLTQGQEAYWTCQICGKMFSNAEGTNEIAEPVVITDGAHTLSKHEGEEADCTSTGTEAYWECTTCGKLFSDEEGKNPIEAPVVIPAGHIEVIDEGFAATCTEPGKTDGKHCSRCNEVLVAQEEISAGHQISHHERIDATFTQDGTEEYWECTRCGLLFSDADGEHEIDSPVVILQIIGQGTSGENLFWKVDREGTLTISGTGAMAADPAWLQVQTNDIKKVIIQDGVTTIGYGAFSNLGNLVSVSIPDSVTSIEDYAFSNCGELTGVLLSEKVTNIGNCAFSGCGSLESFDWPAGVATIPGDVFKDCTSLRTFNVGNQVRTIQAGAFSNCNALAAITFGDDVTNIESGAFSNCGAIRYARADSTTAESLGIAGYSFRVEGANYDLQYDYITDPEKERVATELRNVDKDIVTFVIPDVVTVIGEKAFESCNALGGLEIPSRITSVNSEAFKDCAKLTGVLILGDSTLIAEDVFANVNGVTLYGHANSDAQTFATARDIPFAVIQGTHALTETPRIDATCLTPGQEAYWTCVVCGKMFGDAEGTSEITEPIAIPDGAHTLEHHERVEPTTTTDGTEEYWECCVCHLLFSDANGQTVITEPKIIPLAIALKSSCSEATWYLGLQGYNPERNGLYSYTCMGLFSIPESVWDENERAVDWSLTCTNGPDNFQLDYDPNSSEQKDIFTASLKPKGGTMTTGDSVYSVRALYKGVYYCGTIMTHTVDNGLPTGMTIRIFETDATGATIGSEVSVTNGNATLESGKYYYLTGCFDGINVDIGRQWMNYGAVSKGIVFRGSRWQGDDYSISQWYRICYTNSNRFMTGQTGDYSCEAVLSLGTASNLASRMPLTFTVEPAIIDSGTCGTSAEWTLNSDGLLSITGSGAIETSAFNNRQGVKKIIISEGITEIGNNTFALCYDLEEVQLPDGFDKIGNYAFAQCTKLENINIPGSITVIGTQSFSSCTALVSVDIPYETDVSPDAFTGCSNLTVYGYASSSAEKAANENSFIAYKSGTWGEDVAWSLNDDNELAITGTGEIKNGHPWGTDVQFVTIEEGITAIGSENFLDCVSLTSVTLPDSVTIIQNGAFNGCISLKSVSIPVRVSKIEAAAFGGCEAFTDVYYGGLLSQWSGIEIESTDNDRLLGAMVHCNHLLSKQVRAEATCTEEGTEEYWVCSGCGKMFSDEAGETEIEAPIPIPAEGHSFTAYAKKEATCTEPGHIAYWDCSRCHKLFSDAEGMNEISDTTIDALGHEEVIDEAEEPTCTEDGRTEGKHCGRCNEVLEEREVIPANGHTEVIDPAVAPTSTEPGLTEGKHCSVCKAILVPQEEIPPTGDPNKFTYISDGNPEGDEEEIQFTCFDQICEEGIHSYTRQQLDNGNTRFTLQFTMPAGLHISVFDPPDGNTFKYVDFERVTSAEQSILQFDLTDDELDNIGEITVMFFNDEINTGVHVNLDSIVPDPKPAEKDYITFGLTDGTPAEEEADRLPYYFSRFDGAQGMTGTLQNAVRQRLNNGKSRITIQYSVPAGLRVLVVARPNATELYDSNAYNIVTASGRSVLQFDIPDSTYDTFSAIQFLFQKPNCNVFGLLVYPHADTADPEQATIVMNRTDGIPVGDETDVRIVSRGNWSGTVYGGRMQKLNNGYFRFTLRFSVPDGSFARVAGRAFDYYCATVGTSSIHDTLQVDIPSDGLQGWDYFTVQFTYLDEANSFSVDADVYYYDLDTMNVLYLPDGLNTIEAEAFEGLACEAVVVPAGCESIGDGAFRNCKNLKYVRVSIGTVISGDAFEGCGNVVIERVGNE